MESRPPRGRGYGQFCGLARALDLVGERWTLLIVRELLVGPRRFGELRDGLGGVATNLLSGRLRQLEADGLVERSLGAPGEGMRYALTARGRALRPVVEELVRWGAPSMASGRGTDHFRPDWLAVALPALLPRGPAPPVVVALHTQGAELALESGPTGSVVRPSRDERCAATLSAEPEVILGLASGALDLRAAARSGARISGDRSALARAFGGPNKRKATRRSRR